MVHLYLAALSLLFVGFAVTTPATINIVPRSANLAADCNPGYYMCSGTWKIRCLFLIG
jgi:hypothetical protein